MKKPVLGLFAASLLWAGPVQASEFGLLVDKQIGRSNDLGYGFAGGLDRQEAARLQGFGLRGAYTLGQVWGADFALHATYHPKAKADFIQDLSGHPPQTFGKYTVEYVALGGQLDWKWLGDVHAGLDVRREQLDYEPRGGGSSPAVVITRPWVSAGIGWSFPAPARPFVRLEGAYALRQYDLTWNNWDFNDLLRAMAPRYQIGLYAGIHF